MPGTKIEFVPGMKLNKKADMRIGGLLKFSLIDFPGKVAAVIFTQGCDMRCSYCHNPELVLPEKFKEPIDEAVVFDFLNKRRKQLQGVSITGGEPTIQKDLIGFIAKIKALGFSVKLDTNGSNPDVLKKLIDLKLLDYIAMDVKAPFDKYNLFSNDQEIATKVHNSINIIKMSGVDYQFRTTFDKTILSDEDIARIKFMLKDAMKYNVQNFVLRDNLLSDKYLKQANQQSTEVPVKK